MTGGVVGGGVTGARVVGVGVVGLGRIGALHAEHVAGRVPFARLVRVADLDGGRARQAGEHYGARWSADPADVFEDDEVDAVVIATPSPTHPDHVERAASAGKAVFCEKPLALAAAQTQELIDKVRVAGVPLQVGFHRRFDPDTAEAKSLIASGEVGEVYSFRTSLRDMYPQPLDYIKGAGSFFVDVTIHDLDLARWLVGEVVEVSAYGASVSDPAYAELGTVDHAVVVLRFAGGALGVIDNSRIAGYGYEASTEVVGARAALRIDHSQRTDVTVLTGQSSRRDHVADFVERFREAYRAELEAFIAAVRSSTPPAVTGEDALAAFLLARACEQSLATGRPVVVDPPGRA